MAPNHSEIPISRENSSYSIERGVIDAVNTSLFNKLNIRNTKEDQVMTKDEGQIVWIIPFQFELVGVRK